MYTDERILELIATRAANSLKLQVRDRALFEHGAFMSAEFGMADPFVHALELRDVALAFLAEGSPLRGNAGCFDAVMAGIAFLRRRQRPTGRIDLSSTNFDSPPDTAFTLEWLCPVLDVARRLRSAGGLLADPADAVAKGLEAYLLPAARGVNGAGATTPNHRWCCCAALAHAMQQFPGEIDASDYINAFLAETIDQTEDGEYSERSMGIYNAVVNRSLRRLADHFGRPDLLDNVRRNLDLTLAFMQDDGSIVTNASHRRDRGKRVVPVGLAASFFDLAMRDNNGRYATAADILIGSPEAITGEALELFPEHRGKHVHRLPLPGDFAKTYHAGRFHRIRRGAFTATIAGDTLEPGTLQSGHVTITPTDGPNHNTTPLLLQWGGIRVRSVKVCASMFARGQFIGDEFHEIPGGIRLVHRGAKHVNYVSTLPLGRPVPVGTFYASLKDRTKVPVPPIDMTFDIVEVAGGLDLRLKTDVLFDHVPLQVEIAIEGAGEWETDDAVSQVGPGVTTILKSGHGVFRRGADAIRIGPGACNHRMWQMRGSETANDSFRVLLTYQTPVATDLQIRVGTFRPLDNVFEPA